MIAGWIGLGLGARADPALVLSTNNLPEFITGSRLNVHGRAYFIRVRFDDPPQTMQSLAAGGWLEFESGLWHGLGFGLAPYTSQRVYGEQDQGGADVLKPDQSGYTVLGQAYVQGTCWDTRLRIYRQVLNTPFLNQYDWRMTPVTYEAYTLENNTLTNLTLMVSHVTGIKPRTSSSFQSLTEAAGFNGTNEPVTLAGVVATPGACKFQLWNYYCYNFMNVVYAQADGTWELTDRLVLSAAAQGYDQQSTGDALGGNFHTGMGGILGSAGWDGLKLILSFTTVANNHDIVNPWGNYPGYTSIMEEDCNLAGEKAWGVTLAYDFTRLGLKGLSSSIDHTEAWVPDDGSLTAPAQLETNITVDYRCWGRLNGLWVRLQTALLEHALDTNNENYNDYRVIINYDIANLLARR